MPSEIELPEYYKYYAATYAPETQRSEESVELHQEREGLTSTSCCPTGSNSCCPTGSNSCCPTGSSSCSADIPDGLAEISRALQEEYPKMRGLCGGWLLKKAAGGSGKRKITSLPQGTQGYTGKILKTSSNSGNGPRLTGLSPAVLHVLAGGTPQTATIALEDMNDIDVRETIGPLYEVCESNNGNLTTLSVEQRDAINKLAVEMDYSILKETNRCWLLHNLLQDAVFGRIKEQLKQIKHGLKETYVLDLLEARPDAITQVFPSEAEATCSPEVVLDFIQWPQEDDGQEPKKIKEFLMQFISTVSQEKLKQLVKFWVGWEIPMTEMKTSLFMLHTIFMLQFATRTQVIPVGYG
ncbi:unnamed protein product [Boreogadus saida]